MKRYKLSRDIPIEDGYDVFIAGGGPAGVSAAICAARMGAKTLLAEATGCLGGMGTAGQVAAFNPMSDGKKRIVGGLMAEIVELMFERGYMGPWTSREIWEKGGAWLPFQPEGLKLILDELVIGAGVELRFFNRLIDVDADDETGTVNGVILHSIEGYTYINARSYIDCTGDAVFAALCGVFCREAGKDTSDIMPATLTSIQTGIDWSGLVHPTQDYGIPELIEKAHEEGVLSQCDRHLPGLMRIGENLGFLNAGHIFGMNALKSRELTAAMIFGRKQAREYLDFYQKYVPGCKKMEIANTSGLMGVRESRRIVGEYELCYEDFASKRHFDDEIGVFCNFIDIHIYDCSKESFDVYMDYRNSKSLQKGDSFGIPYRILVPKGWNNLWVAGRCVSCDVKMQAAIRVMPAASIMGQAAGTAAVLSLRENKPASALSSMLLTETLKKHGAYLPVNRYSEHTCALKCIDI